MCVAHKGFVWLDVETAGVAAHGSRPDLGVDAIAAMGEVLVGLINADPTAQRVVDPQWRPTLPSAQPGTFTMADVIALTG